jgi:hypothetical protein
MKPEVVIEWFPMKGDRTRVLQMEHGLDEWIVINLPGSARGICHVQTGPRAVAPPFIRELMKDSLVYSVITGTHAGKGYLMITATDRSKWGQIARGIEHVIPKFYTLKGDRDARNTPT